MAKKLIVLSVLSGWLLLSDVDVVAAEVEKLEVQRMGDDYTVTLQVLLKAPLPQVWRVLTDYAHLSRLSPAIQESELVQRIDARTHRVRTLASACVLIFCKTLRQVQRLHQRALGELDVVVEPEQSDLEFGWAHWHLREDQRFTRLQFEARLRPAFWVPPLIGPWAIQRALEQEARVISEGLEQQALTIGP